MSKGKFNLITDVAGLKVGNASDVEARTGVTVVTADVALRAAVDVRGGGPGTRETEALALDTLVERVDALVLSGGSVYGLAAADAVCRQLGGQRRGFSLVDRPDVPVSPIVPAAILYDLANGGSKDWGTEPPYARLGEQALQNAGASFNLGPVGAGTGATAGAYRGGLGSASWVTDDGFTVAAMVAVNSFGSPYVAGTNQFWAAPFEVDDEFGGRGFPSHSRSSGFPTDSKIGSPGRTHTTLAVVATDADLSSADLQRMAIMAQDGLARAIRPAHGPTDGDIVFVLSTTNRSVASSLITTTQLGSIAGDVLARAVARGVFASE